MNLLYVVPLFCLSALCYSYDRQTCLELASIYLYGRKVAHDTPRVIDVFAQKKGASFTFQVTQGELGFKIDIKSVLEKTDRILDKYKSIFCRKKGEEIVLLHMQGTWTAELYRFPIGGQRLRTVYRSTRVQRGDTEEFDKEKPRITRTYVKDKSTIVLHYVPPLEEVLTRVPECIFCIALPGKMYCGSNNRLVKYEFAVDKENIVMKLQASWNRFPLANDIHFDELRLKLSSGDSSIDVSMSRKESRIRISSAGETTLNQLNELGYWVDANDLNFIVIGEGLFTYGKGFTIEPKYYSAPFRKMHYNDGARDVFVDICRTKDNCLYLRGARYDKRFNDSMYGVITFDRFVSNTGVKHGTFSEFEANSLVKAEITAEVPIIFCNEQFYALKDLVLETNFGCDADEETVYRSVSMVACSKGDRIVMKNLKWGETRLELKDATPYKAQFKNEATIQASFSVNGTQTKFQIIRGSFSDDVPLFLSIEGEKDMIVDKQYGIYMWIRKNVTKGRSYFYAAHEARSQLIVNDLECGCKK